LQISRSCDAETLTIQSRATPRKIGRNFSDGR
jgi:hypothetical protein